MRVWIVSTAIYWRTFLGKRVFFSQFVVVAVQIVDILGNDDALGVLPWTLTNSVARIDCRLICGRARTQVGAPGFVAGSDSSRKPLANCISSGESPQVGAITRAAACDKEAHIRRVLRERWLLYGD